MNNYKSSAELKAMAKEQLFGKYGQVVGAFLIVAALTAVMTFIPTFMIGTTSVISTIIYYLAAFIVSLFTGIFASGKAFLYLKVTCNQPVSVSDVFYGFKSHPDKALVIQFVLTLISYVCTIPALIFETLYFNTNNAVWLLLTSVTLIIGMAVSTVAGLLFAQAFYLLQDFPEYSAKELLKMSCHIMKGHKGRLFYIQLSFIPLFLLGILSCCIAFLWVAPYMRVTMANFYMDLMQNRNNTPVGRTA